VVFLVGLEGMSYDDTRPACFQERKDRRSRLQRGNGFGSPRRSVPNPGYATLVEDPHILRLNIRHYRELLKLDRHSAETRQRLIELLAEAQAELSFASAAIRNRNR
jgi:hypothetical protein